MSQAPVTWSGPHPLQIDSFVTGLPTVYAVLIDGTIKLEVTNGCEWWRGEIAAPWATDGVKGGGDGA